MNMKKGFNRSLGNSEYKQIFDCEKCSNSNTFIIYSTDNITELELIEVVLDEKDKVIHSQAVGKFKFLI